MRQPLLLQRRRKVLPAISAGASGGLCIPGPVAQVQLLQPRLWRRSSRTHLTICCTTPHSSQQRQASRLPFAPADSGSPVRQASSFTNRSRESAQWSAVGSATQVSY